MISLLMHWEKTFDMIIIVPIFNFERRNSQRCYAKNKELLLCNYFRSIIDFSFFSFYQNIFENFRKLYRKTSKGMSKCWHNVIKRLRESRARPRK